MTSLSGSLIFSGHGSEQCVGNALEAMGFVVSRNVLLQENSGTEVENFRELWERHIRAKEWSKGNRDPWRMAYHIEDVHIIMFHANYRPPVVEVDLILEPVNASASLDFDVNTSSGIKMASSPQQFMSVAQFRDSMNGHGCLVEVTQFSRAVRPGAKNKQRQNLLRLASARGQNERVLLLYNGRELGDPPAADEICQRCWPFYYAEQYLHIFERLIRQDMQARAQAAAQAEAEAQARAQAAEAEVTRLQNELRRLTGHDHHS